jgi:hypothetical protein
MSGSISPLDLFGNGIAHLVLGPSDFPSLDAGVKIGRAFFFAIFLDERGQDLAALGGKDVLNFERVPIL